MADKIVLFFTAGAIPTTSELTEINKLVTYPGIDLRVRNAAAPMGTYDTPETADYVCDYNDGSLIPAPYDDTEDYPLLTRTNPPAPAGLLSTQKVITSGVEFLGPATTGSRTDGWTPTIVAGAVTVLTGS